ncbi:hypothetical protein MKD38_26310 [Cupriavidus sp. WGlv3]|uniref:hypothetical protein n=1 Tax=Cupriavidus sp. WGlv3 TaxID=2919924 RepID=UPI0020904821|nr:hypothetical protein [Cupriavidus sp. WGlv3]MCO4865214.1 hypothetical protein [Cupriavidus sp. WGlv3]
MRSRILNALKITALGAAASISPVLAQNAPDNAIRNADGTRTILRSQQLPDANERHARWCQLHGGVDITNDGDVTLGPKTLDAVVCRRLDPSVPGFSGAYIPKSPDQNAIAPDTEMEKAPFIIPQPPRISPELDGRLAPNSSAQFRPSASTPTTAMSLRETPSSIPLPMQSFMISQAAPKHASYRGFHYWDANGVGRA